MAQTTPVIVTAWTEPQGPDFDDNADITIYFSFMDRNNRNLVDPDSYLVQWFSPVVGGNAVGTGAAVKDAVGQYHLDFILAQQGGTAVQGTWIVNITAIRSSDSKVIGGTSLRLNVFSHGQ